MGFGWFKIYGTVSDLRIAMGHGYKHRETKGELIQWLQRSRDEALWARLASTAVRDWAGFAQHLKKAWSAAGGDPYDLRFLDNKQHAVHVWQTVNKPARQQKRDPRSTGGPPPSLDDLMNWLWYYENDELLGIYTCVAQLREHSKQKLPVV